MSTLQICRCWIRQFRVVSAELLTEELWKSMYLMSENSTSSYIWKSNKIKQIHVLENQEKQFSFFFKLTVILYMQSLSCAVSSSKRMTKIVLQIVIIQWSKYLTAYFSQWWVQVCHIQCFKGVRTCKNVMPFRFFLQSFLSLKTILIFIDRHIYWFYAHKSFQNELKHRNSKRNWIYLRILKDYNEVQIYIIDGFQII